MLYRFDDYELDNERYELRRAGEPITVEPKAFTMLAYLLQHRDRAVTKTELLEQLWPGTFVSESALTRCLTRARQAVGDDGVSQRVIKTVWGHGYRFVAPVAIDTGVATPPARLTLPPDDHFATVLSPPTAAPRQRLCARCQAGNTADRMFCATCGAMLVCTCSQCGFRNAPEARFCGGCGTGLAPGQQDPPQEQSVPLSLPRHLTEQILTSREGLVGERKTVTVLVVGLKGLSEVAHTVDPEAQRQVLNGAVQRMLHAIHGVEGFVTQFTEQGLVALFGAPLAAEDHVLRALHAALGIQRACSAYIADIQQRQQMTLDFGMGVHCGTVVVGAIGDDVRMAYTAQGFTLTLAHRLQEQAQAGAIYVSAAVQQQAAGLFQFAALDPAAFRELPQPMGLYACTGRGPLPSRLAGFLQRRVSRFLGRDADMAQLRRLWTKVEHGEGQVVVLFGEAGMGKSRLAYEFRHTLGRHQLLEVQALSYGRQMPYHAIIPVLHRVLEASPGASGPPQLQERLAALHPHLADEAQFLAPLLNMPWVDAPGPLLTPEEHKQRLQQACVQVLLHQTVHTPVCFVVEDLHWLDDSSQELLDRLIAALASRPLLLLGTARPGFRHPWADYTYFHRLTIAPLLADQTTRLIHDFCQPYAASATLTAFVQARTGGNPFFVEEMLHALQEHGQLLLHDGTYALDTQTTVSLPASVQAVVAARIDQLPAASKLLLQTAAVIGAELPLWLLRAVADGPQEELSRHLTHLQKAELFYERPLSIEPVYTFKHALTQEVAYQSLVQARRRALHARVLQALEGHATSQSAVPIEQLAYHAQHGEVWEHAVHYLRQAGVQAMTRAAHEEAMQWFEQALEAIRHLPESRSTQALAIDLRFDLLAALQPLGAFQRALEALRSAAPLAETLHDQPRLARITSAMAFYYRALGDHEQAVACGQQTLTLSAVRQDIPLQIETLLRLGTAYHGLGQYAQALATFTQAREALARHPQQTFVGEVGIPAVLVQAYPLWSMAEVGAFAEGLAWGEAGLQLARAAEAPYSQALASCAVGALHVRQGNFATAIALLEEALHLCQARAVTAWIPGILSHLGYAYALSGRVAESVPLLDQASTASQCLSGGHALWITWLGEAFLLAHRVAEARTQAQRALALAQQHQERGHQAWGLRLLGAIALHDNTAEPVHAETCYHQALALADELGMSPLRAHCHLGLATLYRQWGRRAQAGAALRAAIALLGDHNMTYWRLQAEAPS